MRTLARRPGQARHSQTASFPSSPQRPTHVRLCILGVIHRQLARLVPDASIRTTVFQQPHILDPALISSPSASNPSRNATSRGQSARMWLPCRMRCPPRPGSAADRRRLAKAGVAAGFMSAGRQRPRGRTAWQPGPRRGSGSTRCLHPARRHSSPPDPPATAAASPALAA